MKDDFDKAICEAVAEKDVNYFGRVVPMLAKKYGVCEKTCYNRFKSWFKASPRDFLIEKITPTKEEIESAVLITHSVDEFNQLLSLPNTIRQGLFDRVFGVSSYTAVKELILMSAPKKVRGCSFREDNISLLMSQYLGDGYYDKKRHALRVCHGERQAEYLRWKVGLIFEGYNKVSTEIGCVRHAQGHLYYHWYSGKLGHVVFPEKPEEAVPLLTPVGWLLWYFDDGHIGQDLSICIKEEAVANRAKTELETYGITSRVNKVLTANAYNLTMCGGQNTVRFYKEFIEPFLDIIPECMKYKTEVKI